MGRKTHGPYVLAAIEEGDITKVSSILSTKFRDKSKVKTFLASEVKRLASDCTEVPLLLAATLPDPTIIQYMVEKHDANINFVHEHGFQKCKKRTTPLLTAVKRGLYTTVDALIGLNANVNFQDHKGRSPLHHSIRRADYRMVKLLLTRGAQTSAVDVGGNSPLHLATIYGHSELIKLLIRYGGDLYKKGQHGAIPIHMASREGHAGLVRMFCEIFEVNPDIKVPCYDELEKSPLHVAASQGHGETVLVMIEECGADVNLVDSEGNTPLHHTVLQEYDPLGMKVKDDITDTVKVLLNKGCEVNVQNRRGETAMHLAARNEFQKVIEVLVSAGCDPLIEDNGKSRAIDLVDDEDTVSKQMIKKATEDRNRIMNEAPKVRARGFVTNFQRGTFATASSHSVSLLNMSGANGQRLQKSFQSNSGQHSKGNLSAGNGLYSSSNSSKKLSRESINSGSRLPEMHDIPSMARRRVRSVENLDSRDKRKKAKERGKLREEFHSQYLRKNSYEGSEVTSRWSISPPNSVSDVTSEVNYKRKKGSKQTFTMPKTIRECHERTSEFDDDRSVASEVYFLDDDESVGFGLERGRREKPRKKSGANKLDRVNEWMQSQTSLQEEEEESGSSDDSRSSYSDSEVESHHRVGYEAKQTMVKKPVPPPKPNKRDVPSNVEKVIELEVDDRDLSGHTTIRVIPMNSPKSSRGKVQPHEVTKQPPKRQPASLAMQSSSNELRMPKNPAKQSQISRPRSPPEQDAQQFHKPQPKKRNVKSVDRDHEKVISPTEQNFPVVQSKQEKDGLQKKSLFFEKASNQPMDNFQHSNLARISAGDKAAPSKPTYSSSISSTLMNSTIESGSKLMEHIHNKSLGSNLSFNNSLAKADSSNSTWNAAEESFDDVSSATLKNSSRIVSFSNNGGLPFTLAGGNKVGIFVDAISQDSSASKNGLLRGDKINRINGTEVSGRTREEVDAILRQHEGYVTLDVKNEMENYKSFLESDSPGDHFHVKAHFSCDGKKKTDLDVRPGEVFLVVDSMPPGNKGFWAGKLIGPKNEELKSGLIPNEQKAMQIVTSKKLLEVTSSSSKGGFLFDPFRRKKKESHMSSSDLTEIGSGEEVVVVYERVELTKPSLLRPVIILGLFCNLVINRLLKEYPDCFEKARENLELELNGEPRANLEAFKRYGKKKHLLAILSPPAIEHLVTKSSLSPIVVYLAPVSKVIVKAIRNQLDPTYAKDVDYMLEEALRFQDNYKALFTKVINYTADDKWFYHVADFVTDAQSKPTWQPVVSSESESNSFNEPSKCSLDESSMGDIRAVKKPKKSKRISLTTDDIPIQKLEDDPHTKPATTSGRKPSELPEKIRAQAKKSARTIQATHETPL